eukprot:15176529-Ditylum_brightwellii.AAC.1
MPIHTEFKTLKNVVCSVAEAECGSLFHNGQLTMMIRNLLMMMGHPQAAMHIKTDDKTANSFVHASMNIKRSKYWDMCYHWLRKAAVKKALQIYWD